MTDYGAGWTGTWLVGVLAAIALSGADGATDCSFFKCPNPVTTAVDYLAGDPDSKSFCCRTVNILQTPYCCDWKDYAAYAVGLDPQNLAIPVSAILGILIGGLVLVILLSICCCFCCGICCFRGRKRLITQHSTVSYGKANRDA